MNLFDQVKTSQGRLPVVGARVMQEEGEVRFDIASPEVIASGEVPADAKAVSLEQLAVIKSYAALERFARESGPLFGANACEPLADWQNAMAVAKTVLLLQGFVNNGGMVDLDESAMVKTRVSTSYADNAFSIYSIAFDMGRFDARSPYRDLMPSLPLLKKFVGTGCFDYAFFQMEEDEEGRAILAASLISFEHEISLRDFAVVASYFEGVPESVFYEGMIAQEEGRGDADLFTLASDEIVFDVHEAHIGANDVAHVQNFAHALIWLHLQRINIDVFRPSEDDDFLTFDAYANYLWYGFSRTLKQVKIGFCQQCRSEFSLTGHRGIARRFCSAECKTKAKNERAKRARDDARALFASGESVARIAQKLYPDDSRAVGAKHVVANLSNWKVLQRDVDAALLALPGFGREVIERFVGEGVFSIDDIEQRRRTLSGSSHLVEKARRHAEAKAAGCESK